MGGAVFNNGGTVSITHCTLTGEFRENGHSKVCAGARGWACKSINPGRRMPAGNFSVVFALPATTDPSTPATPCKAASASHTAPGMSNEFWAPNWYVIM